MPRKGKTLRTENANDATIAPEQTTAPAQAQGEVVAPEQPSTAPAVPESKGLVLIDSRIRELSHGWSKSEERDARKIVEFAISTAVQSAESKMSLGERLNKFAEDHGEKVTSLIKGLAAMNIYGHTESNLALWRIRAKEFPKYFPSPKVRQFVLALSGGEGVIIRDESFDKKDSDGKPLPKPYILSPFWAESIKTIGPVPETDNAEVAELYSRKVGQQATFLRSQARSGGTEDAKIVKRFTAFQKYCVGKLKTHETNIYDRMYQMLKSIAQHTTDLDLFSSLVGKLDKLDESFAQAQDADTNGESKPKPQSQAKVA